MNNKSFEQSSDGMPAAETKTDLNLVACLSKHGKCAPRGGRGAVASSGCADGRCLESLFRRQPPDRPSVRRTLHRCVFGRRRRREMKRRVRRRGWGGGVLGYAQRQESRELGGGEVDGEGPRGGR